MTIAVRVWRRAFLCLAALSIWSCQSTTKSATEADVPLDHLPALAGGYFRLQSETIGRPFHIYIRLPQDYDADSEREYPIVYVLDGDSLFPILAANHLFLHYDEDLPEAIIVGIAYGGFDRETNKRGYDFSAPAPDAHEGHGGAPAFLRFLESELMPEVEGRYRVDPLRRVLFGQSRGGYMVLYTAFVEPDLFWGRIASNPVLFPERERFFAEPEPATRNNLGLVVTSGTRDRPAYREPALDWFEVWSDRDDAPWAVRTVSIDGATHAANSADSYRVGMLWLFSRD